MWLLTGTCVVEGNGTFLSEFEVYVLCGQYWKCQTSPHRFFQCLEEGEPTTKVRDHKTYKKACDKCRILGRKGLMILQGQQ